MGMLLKSACNADQTLVQVLNRCGSWDSLGCYIDGIGSGRWAWRQRKGSGEVPGVRGGLSNKQGNQVRNIYRISS